MRIAAAVAASDSTARSASTFCIAGCSARCFPKALRCRAWWTAWTTPQRIEAAEPSRQSSRVWLTMRMIVATPRPSSPISRPRTPWNSTSLDGQRAGAELVLQALDAEAGVAALEQEAGEAAGRLGEGQEDVAGRVGAEPLVAGELVGAVALRLGAGGVGAHVGAALLLGHRHAGEGAVGVARPGEARLPLGGELGALAQGRDRGVGHRDRAHDARADLAPDEEQRGADHVGAGLGIAPGQRVHLALDRLAQAPVPATGRARPRRCGCRSGRGCAGSARCAPTRSECSSASGLPASWPVSRRRSMPQPPPSRSSASLRARSASKTL